MSNAVKTMNLDGFPQPPEEIETVLSEMEVHNAVLRAGSTYTVPFFGKVCTRRSRDGKD
jgi:hypothetical protein